MVYYGCEFKSVNIFCTKLALTLLMAKSEPNKKVKPQNLIGKIFYFILKILLRFLIKCANNSGVSIVNVTF